MKIKSVKEWISLPSTRYIHPNSTVMDIKWEHDHAIGWAAVGNDWSNIFRDLVFQVSYYEIVKDGWKKLP